MSWRWRIKPEKRMEARISTVHVGQSCPRHLPEAATRYRTSNPFPEGCRAPLRGGGEPVGRPPSRRAVWHRRARPRRAPSRPAVAFPHGMDGQGATRGRGWDGRAHPDRRRAVPGTRRAGSLPPPPHTLERHRRSCGRGTTATRAATCGAPARAHERGDSVHMHPDVDVHARYATDPGRSEVKISSAWRHAPRARRSCGSCVRPRASGDGP